MKFEVSIEEFEGPLDLMLHLISKQELDLFDLDIVELTEQYITFINRAITIHLEVASEYMTMLATLIEHKSKRLLPKEVEKMEADYEEDPHDLLVKRLLEYQQFKEASSQLESLYLEREKSLSVSAEAIVEGFMDDVEELPLEGNVTDLIKAMDRLMQRINLENPFETRITHRELSVDDRVVAIKERFKTYDRSFSFSEVVSDTRDIQNFVISFLSILDLIRLNLLTYVIDDKGEIWLRWSE
ncbi:MAG: segregation/condensation protein A [Erysipelothrix sp.]|nr:segregation/condensation protein A [Erysipelothrix sp.]